MVGASPAGLRAGLDTFLENPDWDGGEEGGRVGGDLVPVRIREGTLVTTSVIAGLTGPFEELRIGLKNWEDSVGGGFEMTVGRVDPGLRS